MEILGPTPSDQFAPDVWNHSSVRHRLTCVQSTSILRSVVIVALLVAVCSCSSPPPPSGTLVVTTLFTAGPIDSTGHNAFEQTLRHANIQAVGVRGQVVTTKTDATGTATFHLLIGTYQVRLPPAANVLCLRSNPVRVRKGYVTKFAYTCGQP